MKTTNAYEFFFSTGCHKFFKSYEKSKLCFYSSEKVVIIIPQYLFRLRWYQPSSNKSQMLNKTAEMLELQSRNLKAYHT